MQMWAPVIHEVLWMRRVRTIHGGLRPVVALLIESVIVVRGHCAMCHITRRPGFGLPWTLVANEARNPLLGDVAGLAIRVLPIS